MTRVLALLFLPLLFAFNFSPMSQTIEIGEGKKNAQFLIENESESNIAVELSVKERTMDESGKETLNDTKEVSIFPPQVIVPPHEKRTVRVIYSGPVDIKVEKNYRVIAEQLGLNVDKKTKDKAGIKVLMQYIAALYASPESGKPEIKVLSQTSNGKEMVIVIENQGARHQLLNNPVLKYIHAGEKGEIKGADLPGLPGENVLAGQKRTFRIETKKVIPVGAKLELKLHD